MRRTLVALATTVVVVAWLTPVRAATTPPAPSIAEDGRASSMGADTMTSSLTLPLVSRTSAKGRRGQTLRVTPTSGLSVYGQTVRVTGRGFSELVGIYVGLCVMPRAGAKPTPCGGGADQDGSSMASAWISSNPPPYGANLAIPYKRGGAFSVRIKVSPRIGSYDCRVVRCAVIARADHLRSSDRTWDVAVPVTFR